MDQGRAFAVGEIVNWLKELFSRSRDVVDDSAFSAVLIVIGFVGNSMWALIEHPESWNPTSYGAGAAALASGIGFMFKLRKDP